MDICSHAMDDIFLVVVIYFFEYLFTCIIYFAAGAFSLDQPGWLVRYVLCPSTMLIGEGCEFFFFLSTFFVSSKVYLSSPGAT